MCFVVAKLILKLNQENPQCVAVFYVCHTIYKYISSFTINNACDRIPTFESRRVELERLRRSLGCAKSVSGDSLSGFQRYNVTNCLLFLFCKCSFCMN